MGRKGNQGERDAAGLLQTWWSRVEPQAKFVRTPRSGGWRHASGFKAKGDIMVDPTVTKLFPFCVEVKRREKWDPSRLLEGKSSPVWGWWVKCQKDAFEQESLPMLMFRRNRQPWLVMIKLVLVRLRHLPQPDVTWDPKLLKKVRPLGVGSTPVLYLADRFFEIDPEEFAAISRAWESSSTVLEPG